MFAPLQIVLLYALPFLAVLTLVITVHELGHFLAAKACGVAVDRFSIGFGRPIAHWTDKSGVRWQIGWIPLGGYVRFTGDAEASSSVPDASSLADLRRQIALREGVAAVARYFHFKPLWQRALVVAAGPIANFILAVVIFSLLNLAVGVWAVSPKIAAVEAGSPAAQAGILPGDVVTRLNGAPIDDFHTITDYVRMRTGEPIRLTVQRGSAALDLIATPMRHKATDPLTGRVSQIGYLGLAASPERYHKRYGPIAAVGKGMETTWDILSTTVSYLGRIVTGKESPSQLGSFVGMAQTSGAVAKAAVQSTPNLGGQIINMTLSLFGLAAFLSVGIGFMNLLPVPVLDGGHLLFYAYEAVARRPVGARVQAAGYRVGLALLLGLMLFATWNDLQQIPVLKILGGMFS